MSGKKMALLAAVIIIGSFIGVQAMFGFPMKDLIRNDVPDEQKVVTKSEGTFVVICADQHPQGIPDCPFKIGDTLIITYKQRMASID
jgi:hypothetical protein